MSNRVMAFLCLSLFLLSAVLVVGVLCVAVPYMTEEVMLWLAGFAAVGYLAGVYREILKILEDEDKKKESNNE